MKKLIQNYIHKITENDIEMFAVKNNIKLNKSEISAIYFYVKNEYETLLYHDSTSIFDDLKTKLSAKNYEKIVSVFKEYKEKYKHYL